MANKRADDRDEDAAIQAMSLRRQLGISSDQAFRFVIQRLELGGRDPLRRLQKLLAGPKADMIRAAARMTDTVVSLLRRRDASAKITFKASVETKVTRADDTD